MFSSIGVCLDTDGLILEDPFFWNFERVFKILFRIYFEWMM